MKTYDGLSISIVKFDTQDIVTASTPEAETNTVSCICTPRELLGPNGICRSACFATEHKCIDHNP